MIDLWCLLTKVQLVLFDPFKCQFSAAVLSLFIKTSRHWPPALDVLTCSVFRQSRPRMATSNTGRINLNSPLVYSAAICANSYSKLSLLMAYRQISSILWLHSCSPRVLEKAIVLSLLPAGATTSNCWPKIDLMDTFNLFITFRRCHNCRSWENNATITCTLCFKIDPWAASVLTGAV